MIDINFLTKERPFEPTSMNANKSHRLTSVVLTESISKMTICHKSNVHAYVSFSCGGGKWKLIKRVK